MRSDLYRLFCLSGYLSEITVTVIRTAYRSSEWAHMFYLCSSGVPLFCQQAFFILFLAPNIWWPFHNISNHPKLCGRNSQNKNNPWGSCSSLTERGSSTISSRVVEFNLDERSQITRFRMWTSYLKETEMIRKRLKITLYIQIFLFVENTFVCGLLVPNSTVVQQRYQASINILTRPSSI